MNVTITKTDAKNIVQMIQKEKQYIHQLKGAINSESDRIHALIYLDELERKFK